MSYGQRYMVWMAAVSWDGIRGTDRHLATAMTRHTRILWVDPPISPATPARRRYAAGRSFKPLLSVIDGRLTRLTPIALPGHSRLGVRATTAALVRSQVRWALSSLEIQPCAVVATSLEDLLGYWGPGVVNVLYGTDDYVAGAELLGVSARHLRRQEPRALSRADVVAAVSPQLAQRWADHGVSPVLIPNGCWPTKVTPRTIPFDVAVLPGPVVGLIGQMSDRIDLDVLFAIAGAGFSLLLVGPLDPRWEKRQQFDELTKIPHVHYAGPVPAEEIPSYLAAIDVGVTPYRNSPFNRAAFPLKTLEYLGSGLPVVSADLPTARWLLDDYANGECRGAADQILALAADGTDFVRAIRRLVAGYSYPDRASLQPAGRTLGRADACIAFASRHSWSSRADVLAALIGLPSPVGEAHQQGRSFELREGS